MRWLLHGPMTSAVADALVRHGQQVQTLAELDLSAVAAPQEVLELARSRQLDIVTTDANLSAAPFALDFWYTRVIVYLQLEGSEIEQDDAVDRLFTRYKRLTPGRLYTVTETRVKVRQLPSKH